MGDESEDVIVLPIRSLPAWSVHGSALGFKRRCDMRRRVHFTIRFLMAPNESSSLSVLIERMRVKLKVRPDLRGALREEVEQWAVEAEELQVGELPYQGFSLTTPSQAELHTTLRVEAIADPDFERPSEVDDLAREVKEVKEWFGSVGFLVSPEFLDAGMNAVPEPIASRGPLKEPEVVGGATKEPRVEGDSMWESENSAHAAEPIAGSPGQSATVQPVRTKRRPMFLSSEDKGENTRTPKKAWKERTRSPSPEVVAVEPTPAHRRKGRANALVTESDKVLQSVVKHGYPEHAHLLGWLIYNGHKVLKRPAKCGRCLRYGHTCSGEAGKMCGRCIRDGQGCVAAEEYVAKGEKDGREPEVKERGLKGKSKGKAKEKGSTTGPSSISSKGVLDTSEGTRTSSLAGEERMEDLVERSEELMRSVSRKLNDLSGEVLELEGVQAMLRKLTK
ncbi:hypothetical protein JB92DRAFT_3097011 [Gautieria morchelliformis]|nr:hypothetical protein JB92DRAFT_3097011 [Gautieria morchelliformis]